MLISPAYHLSLSCCVQSKSDSYLHADDKTQKHRTLYSWSNPYSLQWATPKYPSMPKLNAAYWSWNCMSHHTRCEDLPYSHLSGYLRICKYRSKVIPNRLDALLHEMKSTPESKFIRTINIVVYRPKFLIFIRKLLSRSRRECTCTVFTEEMTCRFAS